MFVWERVCFLGIIFTKNWSSQRFHFETVGGTPLPEIEPRPSNAVLPMPGRIMEKIMDCAIAPSNSREQSILPGLVIVSFKRTYPLFLTITIAARVQFSGQNSNVALLYVIR